MAKLNRSALIHFINATPSGQSASWFKIGKDVEDMSVELNPEIETEKNILDETSVNHNGYEASFAVDTYFADPEDAIYDLLESIAMQRLTVWLTRSQLSLITTLSLLQYQITWSLIIKSLLSIKSF